jgi:uncharacterized protein YcfL
MKRFIILIAALIVGCSYENPIVVNEQQNPVVVVTDTLQWVDGRWMIPLPESTVQVKIEIGYGSYWMDFHPVAELLIDYDNGYVAIYDYNMVLDGKKFRLTFWLGSTIYSY